MSVDTRVAPGVKNTPASAGDVRDSGLISRDDPLEEGKVAHSRTLAWRIRMDRGAWQATVHGTAKSRTRLKRLSIHAHTDARWVCPV